MERSGSVIPVPLGQLYVKSVLVRQLCASQVDAWFPQESAVKPGW